ncbi:MAG: dihydrofolate reductase [Woeseiaceae bacterium]
MTVSLIVAASTNNVIGSDGELPWHLPDDLRNFKRLTTGKPIVMGRKTFDSIGKPLPDRRNVVISRDPDYVAAGCDVVTSPEAALELLHDAAEVMIIGGSQIYRAFLPLADRVCLTRVHAEIEGDTMFPELDTNEWTLVSSESHGADDAHRFAFDCMEFDRRRDHCVN